MIASLLEFSLRQRILVLGLACLFSVAGVFAFQSIPIDAYPDVTNIQVQVLTDAPGLSPVEVERFITYPLELQMTGLPGLAEIRSLSKFALSQITVVFNDDVDIYFARQLVLERIMAAKERLPEGIDPVMAPVSTGLGEVYQYYVEGPNAAATDPKIVETELTDQRTLQDWVLRPLLKSVPGVIDVNGMGGFVKQYQVLVDPAKLRKFDLTLHDIYEAVAKNNANAGGNVLERHAERAIVRGLGLIKTVSDIESIIVKESGGTPVFVRDVAEVRIGHAVRHGAVVLNGEREVVAGTVLMIRGGNARQVVEAVKTKVEDLQQNHILPAGTKLLPFYDRIELVTAAIDTVRDALIEGIVLVVFVFFFFLGHVRSAVVVTASLIVTPLITFIVMQRAGALGQLDDARRAGHRHRRNRGRIVGRRGKRLSAPGAGQWRGAEEQVRGDSPGHQRSGPADPLRHSHHQRRLPAAHDAPGHGREDVRAVGLHAGDRALGLGRGHADPVAGPRVAGLARRPSGGNAPHAMDEAAVSAGVDNGRSGIAVLCWPARR